MNPVEWLVYAAVCRHLAVGRFLSVRTTMALLAIVEEGHARS